MKIRVCAYSESIIVIKAIIHHTDLHPFSTGTSKRQKILGNPTSKTNHQTMLQNHAGTNSRSRGENFECGRSASQRFVFQNAAGCSSSSSMKDSLASTATAKVSQPRTRGAESRKAPRGIHWSSDLLFLIFFCLLADVSL